MSEQQAKLDPKQTTLSELRDAIANGGTTAVAATDAYLERIAGFEEGPDRLNVYNEVFADRARERAAAVDRGEITGPLAGVPIAIKDNLCTDFGKTTCSSRMLENYRSPFTATSVKRLEDAGAIVLGKTNLDEFAMGGSTEHSSRGATKNPWDVCRVPGGSSGGSAAAVAADLCAGALGSDTGGSIRQPAAFCGIVGLKPTYGRVSRWGLVAFASSLDQVGPIGRSVRDVAMLLQAISGGDSRDSTCSPEPVPDYLEAIEPGDKKLRVGLPRQFVEHANTPAVDAALQNAIKVYGSQGAEIVEVDLPHSDYGVPTYYIVCTAEASSNLARFDGAHYGHRTDQVGGDNAVIAMYSRSRAEGFGSEVKRRIMLGTYALSSGYYDAYYLRALKVRRLIKGDFDRAFEQCDVILGPTTTAPAYPIGEKADDPLAMYRDDVYTVNANLAGIPAMSLPAGFAEVDGKRLPVGVQLFAPVLGEAALLRAGALFENATEFHRERPSL